MIYKCPLKPCPWCKKTPDVRMPIYLDTWIWHIYCDNKECTVQPTGKHVSIRKKGKKSLSNILYKLSILFSMWNLDNPLEAFEAKQIDLSKIDID